MSPGTAVLAPVAVRSCRNRVGPADPLSVYTALTARFGQEDVYLLESVAGPEQDARQSFVGFRELLSVLVTQGKVRFSGVPGLVALIERRAEGLLDRVGDDLLLTEPGRLWDVLRAVHSCFGEDGAAGSSGFGFLAFLGYDTARYIEDLPFLIERTEKLPDLALVLYQGQVRIGEDGVGELVWHHSDAWPDALPEAELLALVRRPAENSGVLPDAQASGSSDSATPDQYRDSVSRCLEHIRAGDIYQVQLGHEISVRSTAEPLEVYRRLRARNPSPYMYLAPLAGNIIIGASPELFVRVEAGLVVMRPIAGTLACGQDGEQDLGAAGHLREDPKEIAEHVMLVDLCRNDIGRICARGSLDVPQILAVERYGRLLHLVSTVVGRLAGGLDVYDVVAALFPAGTMTGAPKVRAMEIIEATETSRRDLYAGALGLIDIGGHVNLALCIRTLVYRDGVYRTRASAGVVADSSPAREWNETIAKLGAARWAVTGEETTP